MSHRVLLGAAAVAALAVAAAVVVVATRDGGSARPAPGPVVATHNPSPGATDPSEYWTRERMRDAIGD
ncbi:hypothetical protein ACFYON_01230 [Micromonospora sp. NPDC005686]|uniref:Uncharacterized protein n=1 Tax=Micromonospora tulbaghiae TaxID=479978 RepID=A0AAW4JMJ8_9ACTN|nr:MULTISPECIES: hypothetical protein [Micromonospora]KAB1905448.1 hypothetical protein F8279_17875 [Micromonospora sp. AMSO1212t]MBO4141043.1 hypothetical protein [Micromonospora tulbaghiae]MDX5461595.1 hypothetical protein [Micromonospora tulbaghiae]SCE86796.1 hypothetical protein GA0070562_3533 [Micromonospora tulbaghiae]